jgi:hypothetical protein
MTKEINLTCGLVATVDDEDYEWLNQFKWCASKGRRTFYAKRAGLKSCTLSENTHQIKMHRQIMGYPPHELYVDHIDGNGLNNQKSNIRLVSNAENARIQHTPRKSRFHGVHSDIKRKGCRVCIKHKGVWHYVGRFSDENEAAHAHDMTLRWLLSQP